MDGKGPLRFEERVLVEGKTPEAAFKEHLKSFDTECGPTLGGAPTHRETMALRPHMGPSVDFAALVAALKRKFAGKAPDRFFIYRLKRTDRETYVLREGEFPASVIYNTPATQFELVVGLPDEKTGVEAFKRLEHGFKTPLRDRTSSPPPPWYTANCQPK